VQLSYFNQISNRTRSIIIIIIIMITVGCVSLLLLSLVNSVGEYYKKNDELFFLNEEFHF
jgi:cell division protein FtsX